MTKEKYVDIDEFGVRINENDHPDTFVGKLCLYNGEGGFRIYIITEYRDFGGKISQVGLRLVMNENGEVTHPDQKKPVVWKHFSYVRVFTPGEYIEHHHKMIEAMRETSMIFAERYI